MFSTRRGWWGVALAAVVIGCATKGPPATQAVDAAGGTAEPAGPGPAPQTGAQPPGVGQPPAVGQPPGVGQPPAVGQPGAAAARPSAGCAPGAPGSAGAAPKTLAVGGVERTYTLVVPAGVRPGVPLPLVFAWHGLGGSGRLARNYFGIEQAAAGGAVFVYPDALPLAMFSNRTGWDLRPEGRDLAFFDALLEEVGKSSCVDLARVFSTGHSFGGYMTNTLGCQRAKVLRAIAPVSGGIAGGTCMPPALPAWIAHASNDGVVPFAQGEGARDVWTHAAGCAATSHDVEPAPCVAFDGCRADAPVTWCVHTGNHAWPPFAGAAIWRFFAGW